MKPLDRRAFLRTGLAATALAALPLRASAAPAAPAILPSRPGARAKNIVVVVSDGMSLGTLALAERHLRRQEKRGTRWLGLYDRPDIRRALMDTASADSLVTDSAAASSAWGSGRKVKNGSINFAPDGRPLTPVMHLARAAGLRTGLVSTATITHATPAGFAVQSDARAKEDDIALRYLEARIDVLLGGGRRFFDPAQRADHRDLPAEFAAAGYQLAPDRAALLAAASAPAPLLGVFTDSHLPYALDHRADPALLAAVPTLAEMTRAALARLDTPGGPGFLLQVEGARVDHAAHANDLGGLLHDQLALDEALGVVIDHLAGSDDTLLIVTSDHGNANPGLNFTGGPLGDTQTCFDRAARFRQTGIWALSGLDASSTAAQVRDRIEAATALVLSADETDLLRRALRDEHREGYRVRNAPLITLGQLLANYTSVGWTGVQHTTDYTELAAFGPGSEEIRGLVQNTALFGLMTRALGLDVRAA